MKRLLFFLTCLVLFTPCIAQATPDNDPHNDPRHRFNFSLDLDSGNHRSIARGGVLVPLHEHPHGLWFAHVFAMGESSPAVEGNFGLGHRWMRRSMASTGTSQSILGTALFFDSCKSTGSNTF